MEDITSQEWIERWMKSFKQIKEYEEKITKVKKVIENFVKEDMHENLENLLKNLDETEKMHPSNTVYKFPNTQDRFTLKNDGVKTFDYYGGGGSGDCGGGGGGYYTNNINWDNCHFLSPDKPLKKETNFILTLQVYLAKFQEEYGITTTEFIKNPSIIMDKTDRAFWKFCYTQYTLYKKRMK